MLSLFVQVITASRFHSAVVILVQTRTTSIFYLNQPEIHCIHLNKQFYSSQLCPEFFSFHLQPDNLPAILCIPIVPLYRRLQKSGVKLLVIITSRTCANCTTVPPLQRGEPSRTQHLGPLSSKHSFLT